MPTEVPLVDVALDRAFVAQVHLCTVISTTRITEGPAGDPASVGRVQLARMRAVLADLLDLG